MTEEGPGRHSTHETYETHESHEQLHGADRSWVLPMLATLVLVAGIVAIFLLFTWLTYNTD